MKDGEQHFVEATANTEQRLDRERIRDVMGSMQPLNMITESVMKLRKELREQLLAESNGEVRTQMVEKFNEDLHDFHRTYLEGLVTMVRFEKYSDMKALPFLSLYARYKGFFEHLGNEYENFFINKEKFGRTTMDFQEYLLSGWDVFVYLLPEPLHKIYDMVAIADHTEIEETDWDGEKKKKGKEIIRRNGECGGRVFAFVYVEEDGNNEEGERVRIFHFYSVSVDGKEMRHFKHERSK